MGEAIARQLLADGYIVYAAARRVERMAGLEQAGARLLAMDVSDEASMQAGMARIIADCGRIDALVNNAGYGSYGSLEETPLEEARRQFEVNVFGLARLSQLAIPHMRAQRSGRIVNVSSMGGKIYEPLGAWYHASKFAVEGLSDSLRLELEPLGLHVIVIQPGAIRTDWGAIAAENLLKVSGSGPYSALAKSHAALLARGSEPRSSGGPASSEPEVVARAVSSALRARRPKTRYACGAYAAPLLFLRKYTSDRMFDKVMRMALGQ